jgi:hypothetical protein
MKMNCWISVLQLRDDYRAKGTKLCRQAKELETPTRKKKKQTFFALSML